MRAEKGRNALSTLELSKKSSGAIVVAELLGHTDFLMAVSAVTMSSIQIKRAKPSQDCSACHNVLASDEKNPKILVDLGIAPAAK